MNWIKSYFLLLALCLSSFSFGQVECTSDVTIGEGTTISMCVNALESLTASSGYVSYAWSGPETATGAVITPNFSGQYVVAATDGVGCVSHDTIQVTINPAPVDAILSSEGDTICPGVSSTTLSLSNSYILYDWGGGQSNPTIDVSATGTYSVDVADANGCVGTFSFNFVAVDFDLTQSGNIGCTGASVTLSASGGSSYLWSTGETGSTIVVNPSSATNYSVQVTEGSCIEQLSASVTVATLPEYELPDTVYMTPGAPAFITGPAGFSTYSWTPSDLVDNPSGVGVFFTGTESATIALDAVHPDGCTIYDEVVVIIIDPTIPNGFSPNNDLINDLFVIPELVDFPGALTVWNRWGDEVYQSDNYQNNWDGTCQGMFCLGENDVPEGTYFYLLEIKEFTFKGYITIKK